MSEAIEKLQAAQQKAIAIRPKVGGFPCLAETLRRAGVSRNIWTLPACQRVYLTDDGPAVTLGARRVTYFACNGEEYVEGYPAVEIP